MSSKEFLKGSGLYNLLTRPSPFGNETGSLPNTEFIPGIETLNSLKSKRVLVLGAGGLGCEILKNLVLSGIRNIDIVDLDTIDLTNLNRQFLFRESDIGKSKAEVAAAFIRRLYPDVHITPHHGDIRALSTSFYLSFDVIVGGLDNIEARRWINNLLYSIVKYDDNMEPSGSVIPYIDGGTSGMQGQMNVYIPGFTRCFECVLAAAPPLSNEIPLCTLATTPRTPEHCVLYIMEVSWSKEFGDRKIDGDSKADMNWVHRKALERAREFGISSFSYEFTLGVVKRIVPIVSSTNSIISALIVSEAVKILSGMGQSTNNWSMYSGIYGSSIFPAVANKEENCPCCSRIVRTVRISPESLLLDLLNLIHATESSISMKNYDVSIGTRYMLKVRNGSPLDAYDCASFTPLSKWGISNDTEVNLFDEDQGCSFRFRVVVPE